MPFITPSEGGGGGGSVNSVTAADTSIVIGGTAANPTVRTNTLDVVAADHPAAADWSNNSHKITSVSDPTLAQDAATKNYVDAHAGVASVFTRTGAVVAVNGDYNGVVAAALTGATAATRYVGGTTSGAPVAGTFAVGDHVVAQDGHIFVCTIAGTPGTWVDVGSVGNVVTSVFGRTGAVAATSGDYTLNQIGNATADYSINSHKLTSVSDPTLAQDAATKHYVDAITPTAPQSGQAVAGVATGAAAAIGSTAIFCTLMFVPISCTVTKVGFEVAVQSGNMMVGVYKADGTAVSREASFLVPGTGNQARTLTSAAVLTPGWYFAAVQLDNSTASLGLFNNCPRGIGFTVNNTFGSGLPSPLGATANSQTGLGLSLLL